ncbi:N-6 DNA methylase [Maridesulfovibrio sp.]|uniref:N-6 DNA methylase n=1 Tax=Maridesulfovibrio sp. TaxID=2795000 RepID=UPI0029F5C1A6|nr:N-6 DNA methylase [Maridesulfovibrio sp.]
MKFKSDQSVQKLRGGYYTPQNLADYITKWVLSQKPQSILEPSCGDGAFMQALNNNNCDKNTKISCFELFDLEAQKTIERCSNLGFKNYSVTEGDFLKWANKKIEQKSILFDGVLGNPPFIRYQFLEKDFQEQAELVFKHLDQKFTKHTNAWVPFLFSALALLRAGGRMGMVIPSEIIHVMHAQSLRSYLGKHCSKIVIIDPKEIWFENTLQGAVIILAEKKQNRELPSEGVGIVNVNGFDFLQENPEELFRKTPGINGETIAGKWTKAILDPNELSLIKNLFEHESVYLFKDVAKVCVGIVTGANNFFLVRDQIVEQYDLEGYSHPMFGRSQHCPGILYDKNQHNENRKKGFPTNFLYIDDDFDKILQGPREYISRGEESGYHTRYKCKIRKPWYRVPSVYSSEIGMLKRCHEYPKLILNSIGAYTTDTAYRVTSPFISPEKLVCSFLNPLTAITAELEGRYYGGGVLELVPSEIAKLHIPIVENFDYDLKKINRLVKEGRSEKVMHENGKAIMESLGYSSLDNELLIKIWQKLKARRQRKL